MRSTLATTITGLILIAIAWIFARDFFAAIPGFERMAEVQPWSAAAAAIWLYCLVFMTSAAWSNGWPDVEAQRLRAAARAPRNPPREPTRMTQWREHQGGG